MLAHHGHPQEISNMIKSCSLWLFCWNWYSLWQKQIHQHWRIKFKFWVNSSRLWDNHCRLHLSTIQPDHPDHPKRRRMARVQTMLIHLGLKAAPAYRPIARKWNQRNGTAAAIKHLRLFFLLRSFWATATQITPVRAQDPGRLRRGGLCSHHWCFII